MNSEFFAGSIGASVLRVPIKYMVKGIAKVVPIGSKRPYLWRDVVVLGVDAFVGSSCVKLGGTAWHPDYGNGFTVAMLAENVLFAACNSSEVIRRQRLTKNLPSGVQDDLKIKTVIAKLSGIVAGVICVGGFHLAGAGSNSRFLASLVASGVSALTSALIMKARLPTLCI